MTILFDPLAWPALIKVLCCFVLVVAATRFKVNLGVCLAGAGLLLGLWMGLTPSAALSAGLAALAEPWALRLGLLVGLILVLSHLMKQAGQLERIVKMFSTLVRSPKVVAGVMPALIGLLPMPGGALFSAPMVEASCPDLGKGGEQGALLATVNYWFRHHGEYWWPLYPGVILAVALLKVEMAFYVLMMMPLAVVHLAGGSWFLLRRIKGQAAAAPGPPPTGRLSLGLRPHHPGGAGGALPKPVGRPVDPKHRPDALARRHSPYSGPSRSRHPGGYSQPHPLKKAGGCLLAPRAVGHDEPGGGHHGLSGPAEKFRRGGFHPE